MNADTSRTALSCADVMAGYEPDLPIVKGATIRVAAGEIHAVFGPNGAGKSTLVKAIAGLVPVSGGTVELGGMPITTTPAHKLIHAGLAFVPQTENIFASLTVRENLELAAAIVKADLRRKLDELDQLFPDLTALRALKAGRLSGGQRQMLACARALMASPTVLILDEPSAGLSPRFVELVFSRLRDVRAAGVTILLVEQNVKAALAVCDRATVLVDGRERLTATPETLKDPQVLAELYFNHRRDEAA
jgi:branched-chain amino acid transport system ATP-binding protein